MNNKSNGRRYTKEQPQPTYFLIEKSGNPFDRISALCASRWA